MVIRFTALWKLRVEYGYCTYSSRRETRQTLGEPGNEENENVDNNEVFYRHRVGEDGKSQQGVLEEPFSSRKTDGAHKV